MESSLILSRVPFRIPLGGGSTDMPSYYQQYGGFVFGLAINMYMDVLIKKPRSDDGIHVHYKTFESVSTVDEVRHEICREALRMTGIAERAAISFKADTPAGTGLGSSGACAVALLNGLSLYAGNEMSNEDAAKRASELTCRLGLPDGKQDPYLCSLGGVIVLEIDTDGNVKWFRPVLEEKTLSKFFTQTLFFYTGVERDSKPILLSQGAEKTLLLKHKIKKIGGAIFASFVKGDLDRFGQLLHEHWKVKNSMGGGISAPWIEESYEEARNAGALGGKILGAGGGGYFMFYCPTEQSRTAVSNAMSMRGFRKMSFSLDTRGARTTVIDL